MNQDEYESQLKHIIRVDEWDKGRIQHDNVASTWNVDNIQHYYFEDKFTKVLAGLKVKFVLKPDPRSGKTISRLLVKYTEFPGPETMQNKNSPEMQLLKKFYNEIKNINKTE